MGSCQLRPLAWSPSLHHLVQVGGEQQGGPSTAGPAAGLWWSLVTSAWPGRWGAAQRLRFAPEATWPGGGPHDLVMQGVRSPTVLEGLSYKCCWRVFTWKKKRARNHWALCVRSTCCTTVTFHVCSDSPFSSNPQQYRNSLSFGLIFSKLAFYLGKQ